MVAAVAGNLRRELLKDLFQPKNQRGRQLAGLESFIHVQYRRRSRRQAHKAQAVCGAHYLSRVEPQLNFACTLREVHG